MVSKFKVGKSIGFGFVAFAMLPVFAIDAAAQELFRGDTVLTRPRPELDPLGVRLGSFFLFPRADVVESFNDNIFATEKDKGKRLHHPTSTQRFPRIGLVPACMEPWRRG